MAVLKASDVEAKLRKHGGNMAAVGRSLGVTRQAVHAYIARHPELQDVVGDCRESMKDDAETALQKAVKDGESWAVCFYLKTQAKDRGYVERSEIRTMSDDEIKAILEREVERLAGGRSSAGT